MSSIISRFLLLAEFAQRLGTVVVDFGLFLPADIAATLLVTTGPITTIINGVRCASVCSPESLEFLATHSDKTAKYFRNILEQVNVKKSQIAVEATGKQNCTHISEK